ncbi:multifunctional nuclease/2',3'-cyclic-nucleotide 2'-phosphodiesterase/5'-nucleotidase/3'-nucleotidase [Paenibacillus taichungensis]|uniref:Multifunctional nuclease/2',3'-cyclic-nucleotide 2'-phosphodiesterase/5'-nucleotidase/3'-nucleotidase n=2 Tax=Paenibacillus taichungensis TaxID=484184 RepID=A0A329R5C0_9BACL|nr:multifunctional nuclease/2',3'-cyclic-nucleotide 2'-phosphodiesterase/5'-nucleotidase/3'-nucleotidase [Paenibacillus taichungensis]
MHVLQMKRWLRLFLAMVLLITGAIPAGLFSSKAAAADEPLTVAQAQAKNSDKSTATVEGYVVGYYNSGTSIQLNPPFTSDTNFALADRPDETDVSKMMPVQVPTNAPRSTFGLQSNTSLYHSKVRINGATLETYFTVNGIKSTTSTIFQLIDETPETKVVNVTANPSSGAVPAGTEVKLATTTVGAAVYYKLNDDNEFLPYTVPITVNDTIHIEAYAHKSGLMDSDITLLDYTIVDNSPISISEARTKSENTPVTVQGIVTYREESGGLANLYIQDDHAGIVIRGTDATVERGDRIEAYGPLTIYNGLLQVEKDKTGFPGGYIKVLDKTQDIPEPVTLTSKDFTPAEGGGKGTGGIYEGMLVEVNAVTVTRSSSSTFYATDTDGGEITIYAKNSPTALATGKTYEKVTGVMTYHTSYGLELIPRTTSDVVENLLSVTASASSGGIVKGSTVTLSSPTAGAEIYYTVDGTEPTPTSTKYSVPITVNEDTIVKAIAVSGGSTSGVYTFTYKVLHELDNLRIHDIQGASHNSLYDGLAVQNVEGIVTYVVNASSFYIQEIPGMEDDDVKTSEGILIYKSSHGMTVGNKVKVSGQVKEYATATTELSTTEIVATTITVEDNNQELPEPVILGTNGRIIPTVIDSDQFGEFNPETDAIDFYESLEGMRVQLDNATIIGPYSSEPGLAVVVDNGLNNPVRTPAGGVILTADSTEPYESALNPQRLFINKKPSQAVKTGDKLTESVKGVMTYSNGNFKVNPEGNLPVITSGGLEQATTTIQQADGKLTIATFNVENFSKKDAARAVKIGGIVVNNLKNPDIIGIMEVQDNDGATDSGTTAADASFQTLIDAIASKGGPTYKYTDIAPENNKDGGAPGGNIRVGFLYNESRVTLKQGNKGDAVTGIQVETDGSLSLNPGRIDPTNDAFTSSRKPLAAEFEFNGERVVVIANHLNSKGGDLKPYGSIQPATRSSEIQRARQATAVNSFVKELLSKDPEVNVAVLGDFNDFQFSKTLNIVEGNELDNLVNKLPENKRYSYIYDGNSQTLDHILVSKKLSETAAIEAVHVNADFEDSHGRVSDHDPLLAQLSIGSTAEEGDFNLRVLHTNDTHAHLDNIPRRVTAIKETHNDNTLVLDAGDVFSGTLYFNLFNGLADLEFMNMIGYDAMTFGNHEFDKGPSVLKEFIEQAEFPFVSANIDYTKDASLGSLYNSTIGNPGENSQIYPAIITEVNGEKVGIFGLTTPDTVSLSSPGDDLTFKDYKASAQATVNMLQDEGINKIIALTHLGYSEDLKLAEAVEGIDIVVGGHSHTILNKPVVVDTHTDPTLVVQTGEYDVSLGQLDVTFNEAGVLKTWNGKLLNLDAKDATGKYVYADDKEAAEKLASYAKPLAEFKKEVIGKTNVFLDGERGAVRKQETNLGNLMTDGMLEKVKSIVKENDVKGYVAIQNGGGIRASFQAGDITLGDLLTVMPFGNNLSALKMTGKEITAALENGVSGVETGEGRFPQVSGLRFYYDSTKPGEKIDAVTNTVTQVGQRVLKVQIKNANGTYTDIDPNGYYIVATNSFMANGGDFYRAMRAAKDDNRYYELNLVDYEIFHEHLDRVGTVNQTTEGRSTDLKGAPLPGDGNGSNPGNGGGNNGSNPGSGNSGGGTTTPTTPVTPTDPTNPTTPTTPSNPGNGNGGGTTPTNPGVTLKDIGNHWAAAAIEQAISRGIVNGYQDGNFRPNAPATRAEFIVMLARAFELPASSKALTFKDASKIPAWAQSFIAQAVEQGIISGYTDETFRASGKVSRVEMTVMLVRALGLPVASNATLTFADANKVPAWAVPYIAAAYDAGLVKGTGKNLFNPLVEATRAEVVTLLMSASEFQAK